MSRINTTTYEQAEGVVKEGYDMFMKHMGTIPRPMEMMSVSPSLFELQLKRIHYYSQHPNLSFALLAHIRYLVAHGLNYSFCMDFNKMTLNKLGLTDEDIHKMEEDPLKSMLEDNERSLLAFVIKSVRNPGTVTDEEFQELRDLGWEEMDMVDALSQGVSMIDHSIMMEAFQIDQSCMVA